MRDKYKQPALLAACPEDACLRPLPSVAIHGHGPSFVLCINEAMLNAFQLGMQDVMHTPANMTYLCMVADTVTV